MGTTNNRFINSQPIQKEKKLKYAIYHNQGLNEYIYKFDVNLPDLDPPEFIFIIDKSGSMAWIFEEIITNTIPKVLDSLGYENRKIHLITFNNDVQYLRISQSELKKRNPKSSGGTYMAKTYDILENIFNNSIGKCNNFRILIISDGMLHDQEETKKKGELFYEKYKNAFKINSQCIRVKTSSEEPDTGGIVSFLKFNNVKCCDLVNQEINKKKSLPKVIFDLFIDDGLIGSNIKIIGDDANFKNFPWENPSKTQPFKNGKYIFFSDKENHLYIVNEKDKILLKCEKGEEINTNNYESIVGQKINNSFQRYSVNRILNTEESKKENKLIYNYFQNLTQKVKRENENDKTLEYLKNKIDILNKTNVSNLNEDIKALYIKDIDEKNIDYNKYGKKYNEEDFRSKVSEVGKKIGAKPLYYSFLLYYALPRVSIMDKAIIIGSLGYLISPIDLIPDYIPVIGLMDDISVLTWAVYKIASNSRNIDDEVRRRARNRLRTIFADMTDEEIDRLL